MAFNPIPVFNGQYTFQELFGRNLLQIHGFLNDVANNPDTYRERDPNNPTQPYPDPNPVRRREYLDLLRKDIIALTPPSGPKYVTPEPAQSILRQGNQLAPTQNLAWQVNNNAERFYLIFDLLGIFLSIIGPAPTGSTAPTSKNYFLPLAIVYARWCRTLVGGGSAYSPTVAQVTWARQDTSHPWFFFLGASAKGWFQPKRKKNEPPPDNPWQTLAQQTRHEYNNRLLPPNSAYRVWGNSPEITAQGGGGWNYGNCGETYPFLYLLTGGMPVQNIFGIAIAVGRTNSLGTNWEQYWANGPIKPPCLNCEYLIRDVFHGNVANFIPYQ